MAVLSGSWPLDLAVLLLGLLGALYVYFTRNFNVWMKKGVPFLKPQPFVGNLKDVVLSRRGIGTILQDVYLGAKGKPYIGIFGFDQPMLVLRDVDVIRAVLVKDFNYFMDRNFRPDETSGVLVYKSLFGLTGQRWKHLRMKLTPTFTSGKMKRMFQLVDACGKQLVTYLDEYSDDGRLEVKDSMARYTTDVIATCAFGIEGHALTDTESEFRRTLKRITDNTLLKSLKTAAVFFAPSLVTSLKLRVLDIEIEEYIRKTIWSTVEVREKSGIVRKDFLDLLMQIKNKGQVEDDATSNEHVPEAETVSKPSQKLELQGDDFVAQAFIFLIAGFETSSTTMSFALYELAIHPEIQGRLRAEIHSVLDKSGGQVTYEGVQEMEYLDRVVAETLRKYPVLPFLDRQALQSYTLPGSTIQLDKGQAVFIPVLGIHWDPEFYPEPDRFDPERFTEENKRKRPNYTYLPFGEGPRNCIGSRMGLMQTKVGLVHVVSHFEVSPSGDTPVPLQLDPKSFLLTAQGPLPLNFRRVK